MDSFVTFLSDNYVWFLVITIILLFALIGYFVDARKTKYDLFTKNETEIESHAKNYELPSDKSLNDILNNSSSDDETESSGLNLETDEFNE